ncbi:subtilisin-like serine protease [Tulasnella sp. 427]|nr:subtilisin-like serine protease [Tulasnella sp. 427]
MVSYSALATIAIILTRGVSAAPAEIPSDVQPIQGSVKQGSYIVKVLDTADKEVVINNLQRRLDELFTLVHDYDSEFFNAFSAIVDPSALSTVASNPNIEYISEDGILRASATQSNAPWGLQRISHPGPLPRNSNPNRLEYTYDYTPSAGRGVNVYVVDTGISVDHVNFAGRARFGYSAVESTEDGNGHGTHCAGTAVGSLYGVARSAHVIAVKVLDDDGTGSTSNIIAGINWVVSQYRENGVPAVMSMSFGGAVNVPLDQAVDAAVKMGVHAVVAAGNNARDASTTSPAHVPSAITVGATTIADVIAAFSNYGPLVDIYAPGQNVISSWIGSKLATRNISGTSMATPHVAGVVAALICEYPDLMSWVNGGNLGTDNDVLLRRQAQHGNLPPPQLRTLLLSTADHTKSGLLVPQLPAMPRTAVDISGATDGKTDSETQVAESTE